MLYRYYVVNILEVRGMNRHVNPPDCIKELIRGWYPDFHGNYVGFATWSARTRQQRADEIDEFINGSL